MNRRSLLAALLPAAAASPGLAGAQPPTAWPARPVRLVVPFLAGSVPDVAARRLAKRLPRALGQPVVVENRPGAGGNPRRRRHRPRRAAPDGYLIGVSSIAGHVVGPAVYPAIPYQPLRDFTHLALLHEAPLTLAAAAAGPFVDLATLLAAARARPGAVRVGTAGNGTSAQVSLELLRRLTGVAFEHVLFRGGPAAALEAVAGRVEAAMLTTGEVSFTAGLRPVAVAAEARMPRFPEAPTFREQGVDFVSTVWWGLCAPARLPEPVADRLHAGTEAVMAEPESAALLARLGAAPRRSLSRAETTAFVAAEAARWGEAARAAGIRAE